MTFSNSALRALSTTCVAVALFAAGCSSGSGTNSSGTATQPVVVGNVVNINPNVLLTSITTGIQQPAARSLGGWEWGGFINSFSTLLTSIKYTLDVQKVSYQAVGADGLTHSLTGLLILPRSIFGSKPSVPILMFQHGTEPYRPYSPSQFLAHLDRPADYPEVMVAAAIASTGYAVAMADYEGLGDNTDIQPYVNGTSLAQQVVGMLRASRDIIGVTNSSPCTWNSQLFLMGYSEGGYVTMTTTRELQLNHAGEFTVTASAPLSGPHDLSGEMRLLMLSNNTSKAPYYLPFLLTAYNYASGGTLFSPLSSMIAPYNTTVPPLFAGNTTSDKISEAMGMSFSPVNLVIPRNLMSQPFIDQLTLTTSSLVTFLKQNDSYRSWVPTVPIRMYHHRSDELVPYGNSQAAFNAFSTAGAKNHTLRGRGVELVEELVNLNIASNDPVKTVHLGAAFPELGDGWNWLNGFKK